MAQVCTAAHKHGHAWQEWRLPDLFLPSPSPLQLVPAKGPHLVQAPNSPAVVLAPLPVLGREGSALESGQCVGVKLGLSSPGLEESKLFPDLVRLLGHSSRRGPG